MRVVLAALAAAWTLRLYRLGWQSFWYDEGTSITVAPRDLLTILANAAADIHPPLYYLLLHVWVGATGQSEYGARLPSAMVGTLLVAVLYRLGRDLLGPVGAGAAAVLAAGAPLPIWYSQEARMYALATTLAAVATLLLWRALTRGGVLLWGAYALAIGATLYSHYFAAAAPLAHGVAVVGWWLMAPRARLGPLIAAGAAASLAGLAFLPWVARTLGQLTGWPATSQPFGVGDLVTRTLLLFSQGQGGDRAAPTLALPMAVLVAVGLAWLLMRRREGGLLIGAYLLVPLAAMLAVSANRPFFHPKFVLLVAPAAELLAAAGAVALGTLAAGHLRWRGASALGASAVVLAVTLIRADGVLAGYHDPRLARDDYRGLAAEIARTGQPGDAIVLNAPGQVELFDYYYRGEALRYPLPEARPPDRPRTEAALAALAERHPRVWLLLWAQTEADPDAIVERFLDERMYKSTSRWFGGVRAALYVNPKLADVKPTRFEVGARFGDLAELASVDVLGLGARAGDVLPVELEWRPRAPSDARYTAFVHLIDGADYLWGQHDGEPGGGGRPTTGWRADEVIGDRHGVPVLVGTPPGQYQLEIGLYRGDTGARLPIVAPNGAALGDRLLLGPLHVQPGRADLAPSPRRGLTAILGGAALRGVDLHPLGRDEAPAELARGEMALLTLFWQAVDRDRPLPVRLELRLSGPSVRTRELVTTQGRHAPERWTPGEWVRDPHKVATDDLAPGRHVVKLAAFDRDGRAIGNEVALGDLVVR